MRPIRQIAETLIFSWNRPFAYPVRLSEIFSGYFAGGKAIKLVSAANRL
ncbi:hypothetical protein FDUTEX481_00646 [Tolypothrix sp. PCC 7601]|nr:hypothetical protein FDUTEX481_00646 [Tolypothrix sp. PCC 7601]